MSGVMTQILIFLVIWWLTLFAVLPWGVRRTESSDAGHDPGAPANPMLLKKAIVTTAVAGVIWGAIFIVFRVYGFTMLQFIEQLGF
jgi:predicted secreted protein